MKKLLLILSLLLNQKVLISQEKLEINLPKRHSFYFEAFGQGLYNTFAYDRLYRLDKKIKTSFTTGFTLIPTSELFVLAAPNFLQRHIWAKK
jgi:hypothetical protein